MANVLYLQLNIHNSIENYIESVSFQLGIISDNNVREFYSKTDIKQYQQKDKNFIHIIDEYFSIVPGSWEKIFLNLIKDGDLKNGEVFNLTIRLFFEFGVIDYPFSIKTSI